MPENVYELKEEEKESRGIESLPADLHAAKIGRAHVFVLTASLNVMILSAEAEIWD